MTTSPKTSAQAATMLETLQAKRAGLVQTIYTGAERRRGLATAAEFGDVKASEALRKIEAEEATALRSLENLDIVIGQVEQMSSTLQAKEAVELESWNAEVLDQAIDGLLALDDKIDDALDRARALLAKREEFKSANAATLRRIPGKLLGAGLGRERELATSLSAYFDQYLGGGSYAAITPVADFDSRYYGKQSPRQIERGPRELTPFERMIRREISSRSAPPIEVAMPPRQAARRR
jgi:hypothetical protein